MHKSSKQNTDENPVSMLNEAIRNRHLSEACYNSVLNAAKYDKSTNNHLKMINQLVILRRNVGALQSTASDQPKEQKKRILKIIETSASTAQTLINTQITARNTGNQTDTDHPTLSAQALLFEKLAQVCKMEQAKHHDLINWLDWYDCITGKNQNIESTISLLIPQPDTRALTLMIPRLSGNTDLIQDTINNQQYIPAIQVFLCAAYDKRCLARKKIRKIFKSTPYLKFPPLVAFCQKNEAQGLALLKLILEGDTTTPTAMATLETLMDSSEACKTFQQHLLGRALFKGIIPIIKYLLRTEAPSHVRLSQHFRPYDDLEVSAIVIPVWRKFKKPIIQLPDGTKIPDVLHQIMQNVLRNRLLTTTFNKLILIILQNGISLQDTVLLHRSQLLHLASKERDRTAYAALAEHFGCILPEPLLPPMDRVHAVSPAQLYDAVTSHDVEQVLALRKKSKLQHWIFLLKWRFNDKNLDEPGTPDNDTILHIATACAADSLLLNALLKGIPDRVVDGLLQQTADSHGFSCLQQPIKHHYVETFEALRQICDERSGLCWAEYIVPPTGDQPHDYSILHELLYWYRKPANLDCRRHREYIEETTETTETPDTGKQLLQICKRNLPAGHWESLCANATSESGSNVIDIVAKNAPITYFDHTMHTQLMLIRQGFPSTASWRCLLDTPEPHEPTSANPATTTLSRILWRYTKCLHQATTTTACLKILLEGLSAQEITQTIEQQYEVPSMLGSKAHSEIKSALIAFASKRERTELLQQRTNEEQNHAWLTTVGAV